MTRLEEEEEKSPYFKHDPAHWKHKDSSHDI